MVKRNIRQIIGVVMAAVFLATIAGSAGASAASGSISEAQKRKTQLENDLNDAQALIEQLQVRGEIFRRQSGNWMTD